MYMYLFECLFFDLFEYIPTSGIQVYYLYKIFLAPNPDPGVLPLGGILYLTLVGAGVAI